MKLPSWRHRGETAAAVVTGPARLDRRTKHLVRRLRPGDIAVIGHTDLDRVAAQALVERRPAAVVNAHASISGRWPNAGPGIVVDAGIPLLDLAGEEVFTLREGERVRIDADGVVWRDGTRVAQGSWLQPEDVRKRVEAAKDRLAGALEDFTRNTLDYLRRDRDLLLEGLEVPRLATPLADRHVLVVVRGPDHKRDLEALRGYIREFRPVLIGVDGGADALLEAGFKPHVILGDMDSVTSEALLCGAEVVVHAYPDGRAPGRERVEALGLEPVILPSAGTSEDVAMLLAYEAGADLIVAVGSHASMVDFLEKGRAGMASTFLVRLRVGTRLVDAKGVNRLYRERVRRSDLVLLVVSAMLAMLAISLVSDPLRLFWESLWELAKVLVSAAVPAG